jgi:hypothetical protein
MIEILTAYAPFIEISAGILAITAIFEGIF